MGRTFTPEEDRPGSERVVVLSHGLWQRRFNGSAKVLGQTLMLDGNPCSVVGVMPEDFHFPRNKTELWMPLALGASRWRVIRRRYSRLTAEPLAQRAGTYRGGYFTGPFDRRGADGQKPSTSILGRFGL